MIHTERVVNQVCVSKILTVTSARMCAVQIQASNTLYATTHSNMHSPTTTNSITNSRHPKTTISTSVNMQTHIHTLKMPIYTHMHTMIQMKQ